jgi:hypothetical protein
MRDYFNTKAKRETDSADVLEINGIKLFDRTEMNGLYQDLIEQLAGVYEGSKTRYEQGMNSISAIVSDDVLHKSSPLWRETRSVEEVMRILDLTEIPEVQEEDLREIIYDRTKAVIAKAPQDSRIKKELTACDRIFKVFNDDNEIVNNVRLAYQKSQPLMLLRRPIMASAGFTPQTNINEAAQKQQLYQQFIDYLQQRARELENLGGEDCPIYAREKAIALEIINQYQLASQPVVSNPSPEAMSVTKVELDSISNQTTSSVANNGNLNQLKELMDMYKEGLLTKEEFQAAKTKLLGL